MGCGGPPGPARDLTLLCPNPHVQSFQLQLQAPSGNTAPAQGGLPITQLFRILNPNKVSCWTPWAGGAGALGALTQVSAFPFSGTFATKAAPHLQPLWPVSTGDL